MTIPTEQLSYETRRAILKNHLAAHIIDLERLATKFRGLNGPKASLECAFARKLSGDREVARKWLESLDPPA